MTMNSGTVRGREALIRMLIVDKARTEQPVTVVLDTGFTGYLALPHPMIRQFGLTSEGEGRITLADGSVQTHDIYRTAVVWHGERQTIPILGMGDKPLIGMRLLTGSRVTMDVVDGGPVTIEPLAA
ncbi:MAG: clan AA aspartic protease [Chloroflexota bacterium]|nr:clan AA aspartic protease [Chloroflexota bacterium]MDE2884177.1 clan AA aspartic protease [Chloroflexota bacterium]